VKKNLNLKLSSHSSSPQNRLSAAKRCQITQKTMKVKATHEKNVILTKIS
jgi:hypothetical protein